MCLTLDNPFIWNVFINNIVNSNTSVLLAKTQYISIKFDSNFQLS